MSASIDWERIWQGKSPNYAKREYDGIAEFREGQTARATTPAAPSRTADIDEYISSAKVNQEEAYSYTRAGINDAEGQPKNRAAKTEATQRNEAGAAQSNTPEENELSYDENNMPEEYEHSYAENNTTEQWDQEGLSFETDQAADSDELRRERGYAALEREYRRAEGMQYGEDASEESGAAPDVDIDEIAEALLSRLERVSVAMA